MALASGPSAEPPGTTKAVRCLLRGGRYGGVTGAAAPAALTLQLTEGAVHPGGRTGGSEEHQHLVLTGCLERAASPSVSGLPARRGWSWTASKGC